MRRVHIVSAAAVVVLGLIVLAASFVPSGWMVRGRGASSAEAPGGDDVDWGVALRKPRGAKYVGSGGGAPGGRKGPGGGEEDARRAKAAKGARAPAAGRAPRVGDYLGAAMRREWDGEAGAWVATDGGFELAARDPRAAGALAPAPRDSGPPEEDRDEEPPDRLEEPVFSVPLNREHGTLASDSTPPLVEQNLSFPEDGDGVRFGDDSLLAFPNSGNLRGEAGTLSIDIEPEWDGDDEGDHSLLTVRTPNDPSNMLRVYKNGRYLRYMFSDDTGFEHDVGLDIAAWESGDQHNVSVTWGDSTISLYVDRRLVGQNTYDGRLQIPPGTPLYVGSDIAGAVPTGARGVISDLRVFGRALGPDDLASVR